MTSAVTPIDTTGQSAPQPWTSNLVAMHAFVWEELVKGLRDRHSVNRYPTLATVSLDGRPQMRTVVLRAVDCAEWTLDVYTETDSVKVEELMTFPCAAIHIWNVATHLQVRMDATATVIQGEEARSIWESLPLASQLTCGKTPATGTTIKDSLAYQTDVDPDRFAVLKLEVERMDVLHLGEVHRRAQFQRLTRQFGQWCVP